MSWFNYEVNIVFYSSLFNIETTFIIPIICCEITICIYYTFISKSAEFISICIWELIANNYPLIISLILFIY